jgi:hypothetical protein
MKKYREGFIALGLLMLLVAPGYQPEAAAAQQNSLTFPETGKTITGRFMEYWQTHGGLAQQGYPISDEFPEVSTVDGKTYTVQYFERAVFEAHPENQAPNDVLLSLLGVFQYNLKYPGGAPNQTVSTDPGVRSFPQTGHSLGGRFLEYWTGHGGLAQQGYPISDLFQETSDLDGKTYTVQYFERAVFEMHPENQAPNDVLLSQLGTFQYQRNYQQPSPTPTSAAPTVQPPATAVPAQPTATSDQCANVPAGQDMTISPNCGQQGTRFDQVGYGFKAGENVGVYVTFPNQSVHGVQGQGAADNSGTVTGWHFDSTGDSPLGIYAVTMEGVQTHHKAIGYFKIIAAGANTSGCDNIPASVNMTVVPDCGPAGTTFTFTATGFIPGETVGRYYTSPTGAVLPGSSQSIASSTGTVSGVRFRSTLATEQGIWAATYEGVQSHNKAIGYFKVTAP